jgi:spore photoproduct lyase
MSTKTMPLGNYSHIYVQEGAEAYPLTQAILQQFPQSTQIPVPDYKGVFNRPGQNFQVQKESPKLILGIKKDGFLYQAKERINSFGQDVGESTTTPISATASITATIVFLQGMHNSGHTLVFVNTQDFFPPVEERLREGKVYLSLSYLTDILAYEHFIPIVQEWLAWSKGRPGLELGGADQGGGPGSSATPGSPAEPEPRLESHSRRSGPEIRERDSGIGRSPHGGESRPGHGLAGEPLPGSHPLYPRLGGAVHRLLEKMARSLPLDQIHALSLGGFRLAQDFLENIRRMRQDVDILYFPFRKEGGKSVILRSC